MRRTSLKKWLGGGLSLLLALLIGANLYVLGAKKLTGNSCPTVFGFCWAVVVSGSMEPAVSVDDLVIVHTRKDYHEGDIILFHSGESLVTHRILEVTPEGFLTKGDANNAPDPVSPREAVVGKVIGTVPGAGRVLSFLQTPPGMLTLIAAGLLLLFLPPSGGTRKSKERTDRNA